MMLSQTSCNIGLFVQAYGLGQSLRRVGRVMRRVHYTSAFVWQNLHRSTKRKCNVAPKRTRGSRLSSVRLGGSRRVARLRSPKQNACDWKRKELPVHMRLLSS